MSLPLFRRKASGYATVVAFGLSLWAQTAAAGWDVRDQGNPLEPPKVRSAYAASPAKQSLAQLGRKVTTRLVVSCGVAADEKSKGLEASLVFSEAAALSPRPVTWRTDQPRTGKGSIYANATGIVLSFGRFASADVISALKSSKRFEIEVDLPWAGKARFDFDTAGAEQSFGKVPCSGPAPAAK